MTSTSFEQRLQWHQLVFVGVIGLFALFLGYYLADNPFMVIMTVGGLGWLMTLPYHSQLSIYVSVATFTSAFILPFFPGRPYFWEFAALLGWSGLAITVFLRRYRPDYAEIVRPNRWLYIGAVGYCIVLLLIMYNRGFGLRILGSEQMGGRSYFQQLVCAVFPFLFTACYLDERTLLKLFVLQCVLTTTYLVSDFVFSVAPEQFYFILRFFEVPNDAVNFEFQAERLGIRRFQSLYLVSTAMFFLLLIRNHLRNFLNWRGVYLIPVALGLVIVGLLSGHRYMILLLSITLLFCGHTQRFYTVRHNLILGAVALLALTFLYAFVRDLPLAAQRAASVLPGISVEPQAAEDARATFETRRILFKVGLELAPQYLWLGRGLGQSASGEYSMQWDPTGIQLHVNTGTFYNGLVGLLVNTGLPGTFFMVLFLGAGSVMAWRVMRMLRALGCEDDFARMCSVVASLWMANVVAFLIFHGDSEWAMKTFSLQAGMLLVCENHLRRRAQEALSAA